MTETTEEIMFQIKDTLVSLDLADQFFCCDLSQCKGECCIEGDAGAPLKEEEVALLEQALPAIKEDLAPAALREIEENSVSYIDEEGDLVTSIVEGKNCVFTCFAPGGVCLCAIDKAFREGRSQWRKPESCFLYPLRLSKVGGMTAINYHKWKICRPAVANGRKLGVRLYQFMKQPLVERFGQEWYDELVLACETFLAESGNLDPQ